MQEVRRLVSHPLCVGDRGLNPFHVSRHRGADSWAMGKEEVSHDDLTFQHIPIHGITLLIDEVKIFQFMPNRIGHLFTPFRPGADRVREIMARHIDRGVTVTFYHEITHKRQEGRQENGV